MNNKKIKRKRFQLCPRTLGLKDYKSIISNASTGVPIVAVLSQLENGEDLPFAHILCTRTHVDKAGTAGEREALACICACYLCAYCLSGRNFTQLSALCYYLAALPRCDFKMPTSPLAFLGRATQSLHLQSCLPKAQGNYRPCPFFSRKI